MRPIKIIARIVDLSAMDHRQEGKILKGFGEKLKKARVDRKLSIRDLAALAEMDPSNLNEIELGETNLKFITLYRLAEALEIDPCSLLPGKS